MVKPLAQIATLPGTALVVDPDTIVPEMQFGNGTQLNATPGYFSSLPAIYGAISPWSLLQWNRSEYLDPTQMSQNASSTYDSMLGNATYSWVTPDGNASLYIYGNGTTTPWVYDLRSSGGLFTVGGGSNLFLSTASIAAGATFDKKITYQLTAKISEAVVSYNNANASTDGVVLAQAFSGFTLWFNEPGTSAFNNTLPSFSVFMQIPITGSNGGARSTDYRSATPLAGDNGFSMVYGHVLSSNRVLPFSATGGAPKTLSYNLDAYLSDLIAQPWPVVNANGTTSWVWMPASVSNFAQWTLTSSYVGLETQNADGRPGADQTPQGTAALGLQISDLQISRDTTTSESPAVFNSQPRDSGLDVSQIVSFAAWQQSQIQPANALLSGVQTAAVSSGAPGQTQGMTFASDPLIDPKYIQSQVASMPATDDPAADFMKFGWQEGWNPDKYFDTNYYLAQYPDVKASGESPLTDYETTGWLLGRNPSAGFSTNGYLAANPDVKASGVNPLVQYLEHGIAEGRAAIPV